MVADLSDTTEIYKCSLTLQDLSKILLTYPKISRSCLQDVSLGYSANITIDTNINIEDLDKLTIRKIHQITSTKESTINLLQNLQLLPITLKAA